MSHLPPTLLKEDPKRKRSLPPYNLDSDIYYNYSKMRSTAYGPKERNLSNKYEKITIPQNREDFQQKPHKLATLLLIQTRCYIYWT